MRAHNSARVATFVPTHATYELLHLDTRGNSSGQYATANTMASLRKRRVVGFCAEGLNRAAGAVAACRVPAAAPQTHPLLLNKYYFQGTHTVEGEGATAGLDRSGTRVEPDMVVQAPQPVWYQSMDVLGTLPHPVFEPCLRRTLLLPPLWALLW